MKYWQVAKIGTSNWHYVWADNFYEACRACGYTDIGSCKGWQVN